MQDLISRQAAIDRIDKQREHLQPDIYPQDKIGDAAYRVCAEFIERLPSAQPYTDEEIQRMQDLEQAEIDKAFELGKKEGRKEAQPEIIRCKDCRWKEGSECVRFADVRPFPDDFCSRAERREE